MSGAIGSVLAWIRRIGSCWGSRWTAPTRECRQTSGWWRSATCRLRFRKGWDTWEAWLTDHDVPPEEWDDGASICDPAGAYPTISFLKVPEPKTAKNRMHLDVKVSGGRHLGAEERTPRIEGKVAELRRARRDRAAARRASRARWTTW